MADYIGITEAQSNPFAPLTSELVKQLRDNPIAIAQGAAGAPRVERAAIEDAGINRVKLDTGTNSVSGSIPPFGVVSILMDPYSFFPRVSGNSDIRMGGVVGGTTADEARFSLRNTDTDNSRDYSVAWRFINV